MILLFFAVGLIIGTSIGIFAMVLLQCCKRTEMLVVDEFCKIDPRRRLDS